MEKEQCKTCKFFIILEQGAKSGWCRRYPPTVVVNNAQNYNREDGSWDGIYSYAETAYPEVDNDDWCGEFK
jgi:hypothetical protein